MNKIVLKFNLNAIKNNKMVLVFIISVFDANDNLQKSCACSN